jgi:hypothetical protein
VWLACLVGVGAGLACWRFLPPVPRLSMTKPPTLEVALSRDFELLAIMGDWEIKDQRWSAINSIWDLASGRRLCSFKFDQAIPPSGDLWTGKDYDKAFTEDGKRFLIFYRGKVEVRDTHTGEIVTSKLPVEFPFDEKRTSRLIKDARGRPYILVKDENNVATISDLLTGQETASFPVPTKVVFDAHPGRLHIYSLEDFENPTCVVRNIPNGDVAIPIHSVNRQDIRRDDRRDKSDGRNSPPQTYFIVSHDWQVITPDCKTSIRLPWVNAYSPSKIDIEDLRTGSHRIVPIMLRQIYDISPNGRYVAGWRDRQNNLPSWLVWLWKLVGQHPFADDDLLLCDLSTGSEAACFAGDYAKFSLDGKAVALISRERLEIYDLPLRRPWRSILGCGVLAAAIVWIFMRGCKWCRTGLNNRRSASNLPL